MATISGQAGLFRGEAGAATGEEFAHVVDVIHVLEPTSRPVTEGGTGVTRNDRHSRRRGTRARLNGMKATYMFGAGDVRVLDPA